MKIPKNDGMPAFAGMTSLALLLAACTGPQLPPVFQPEPVDMPVAVKCHTQKITLPPDAMAALPVNATLTQFTKACAAQLLFDKGAIGELQAIVTSCSETDADPTPIQPKETP